MVAWIPQYFSPFTHQTWFNHKPYCTRPWSDHRLIRDWETLDIHEIYHQIESELAREGVCALWSLSLWNMERPSNGDPLHQQELERYAKMSMPCPSFSALCDWANFLFAERRQISIRFSSLSKASCAHFVRRLSQYSATILYVLRQYIVLNP